MSVGGNIQALLQVKKNGAKNAIGERVNTWVDCCLLYTSDAADD